MTKPQIDLSDDFFGAVLNCAVRYSLGRQSYMPGLVMDFIIPLLPYLSNKTLKCFERDIKQYLDETNSSTLITQDIVQEWESFLNKAVIAVDEKGKGACINKNKIDYIEVFSE